MLLYFLLLLRVISWFESQKCMIKPYHTMEQDHAFLDRALHFIQITWLTYIFASIRRVSKWVQFAGMQLKPSDMGVRWIFSTGVTGGFFQHFSRGGPKMVKFLFSRSKLQKQPFFWNFHNPEWGLGPSAPFRRPCPVIWQFHPVFWDCFHGLLIEFGWKYAKYDFMN